ncbi:MAG: HAD-IA family hydrolase [Verrucomicrobia bacterium]|jgi:phosphoglycolate phosphatase|nr:HAD-IA family hydrolase [Verrucomicrobiota bacterium]
MKYRSLVFDFDGTIADTLGETRRIYNGIAPDYGLRPIEEAELPQLRHLSLRQLLDHLGIPKRRVPALISRGTSLLRERISAIGAIDGMHEAIDRLRPHVERFGILTSNSAANVDLFLRANDLREHFDFISSTSKLTGKAKHLRAIRKTFSLRPEEILFIGDELRDLKAARKAGIPMAAVTWGFNSLESLAAEKPEHLFTHPSQFLSLLEDG